MTNNKNVKHNTCKYQTVSPELNDPALRGLSMQYLTQLSMKSVLLINLNVLAIASTYLLNIEEHENFSTYKKENANYCWHFPIY